MAERTGLSQDYDQTDVLGEKRLGCQSPGDQAGTSVIVKVRSLNDQFLLSALPSCCIVQADR